MPVEAPAAAPVETPAAPASAPESSPAAPASAPASAPATTPAPQAETTPQGEKSPFAGQSIEDTIFKTLEEKRQAREKAEAAPAALQTEEERLVTEAQPKETQPAEGAQPGTAEAKTDEQKAAEAKEPTFDLNEPEINAKWLDDLAKAEKVKFADDATRDQFFKTVREHGDFKKVAEMFPDVESAQEAQARASDYVRLDGIYANAHTPEGTVAFIRELMEKEEANPILPQGQSVVRAMFDNMRAWDFEQYEKQFKEKGDEQGLAALDILRDRISPGRAQEPEEIPPHLAQREAAVKAKEAELSRKDSEQQSQARQQYTSTIAEDLNKQIATAIAPALKAGAFPDAIRESCEEKIYERVLEVLEANRWYKEQKLQLLNRPMSPENQKAIIALDMKYFNTVAPAIIRKTIREFSTPVVQAQTERDEKQKEQEQRSRNEPKGVAAPVSTPGAASPEAFVTKAVEDLTKENGGRRPSREQIIERVVALKQDEKQRARQAAGR